MRKFGLFLAGLAGLFLSACSGPITNVPVAVDPASVVGKDLVAAKSNLQKAVEIGVLKPGDAALSCLSGVVHDLGLDGETVVLSFDPENAGLVSAGSILYIRAQQLKDAAQSFQLPAECEAVVGKFVIDAARVGRKTLPLGGLLR